MAYLEDCLHLTMGQVIPMIQQRIMQQSTYFGIPAWKSPVDFWIYQELVYELKPDVIVEIGVNSGGSTLALAHICDLLEHGRVIGIDLNHDGVAPAVSRHPRIRLIAGDACAAIKRVQRFVKRTDSVLVIEDSSHTFENTLSILEVYSPLIKPGGYFIVEDGICHHGLDAGPSPGPYEAVQTFIGRNPQFEIDRSREAFLITWNPKGYLRRVA
ncbi:MAG TPA: CmcI family methyltransferase [Pyrinomonadaceae bacterium]|nr:CmcI family methyltransferase [Pyrinomonadaceae bacterium]